MCGRPSEGRCPCVQCGDRAPRWRFHSWVPLPACPVTSALTFFRTTNSFSAVALRATSSSYLSVGDRGARAEGLALKIPAQFPGKLFQGQKG